MKYEIKHRYMGDVLFALECGSLKLCVEAAVSAQANLGGADLRDANLGGAYLRGADLRGAHLGDANLRDAYLRGADLGDAYLGDADLGDADLRGAYLRDADLRDADLRGADLGGAYLGDADLGGADLIDGGQDARGYRFWAWRHKDGHVIYRGGCREWKSYESAIAHYGDAYRSDGDEAECLARIELMQAIAVKRWPAKEAA